MYNFKLYRAMRKFGLKNFYFDLIEKCNNDIVFEREKYYIELYNSVVNGYNEAIGGKGKPLWTDKKIEACKILYDHNWLLKDIAEVFLSCPQTVGEKLREKYNINTKNNSINSFKKKVCGGNEKEIINFDSLTDAAKYLIDNNITKNKNIQSVISKINYSLKKENHTAYGYKWFYCD